MQSLEQLDNPLPRLRTLSLDSSHCQCSEDIIAWEDRFLDEHIVPFAVAHGTLTLFLFVCITYRLSLSSRSWTKDFDNTWAERRTLSTLGMEDYR